MHIIELRKLAEEAERRRKEKAEKENNLEVGAVRCGALDTITVSSSSLVAIALHDGRGQSFRRVSKDDITAVHCKPALADKVQRGAEKYLLVPWRWSKFKPRQDLVPIEIFFVQGLHGNSNRARGFESTGKEQVQ